MSQFGLRHDNDKLTLDMIKAAQRRRVASATASTYLGADF